MTPECLVSVITPCFNAAESLPRAVRSVLAQGLPGAEALVVDDRSTDDSRAVAAALAREHPGVRLIEQPVNGGPAAARNAGLRHAAGRYVCFLDADDEYAPGFFARVLPPLQADPEAAAVITGVELFGCRREVHPVQLRAIIQSSPSNLMVRKAVVDLLGGFPEGPVFRGRTGGEDSAFRVALVSWFKLLECAEPYLRYWMQPGSHLEYFLERTRVVDGRIAFTAGTPEEESGELDAARDRYGERARQRVSALACLKNLGDVAPPLADRLVQTVTAFDALRGSLAAAEDLLHPHEGFALHFWAREGPDRGVAVQVGCRGRATCWLASGARAAGKGRVVVVPARLEAEAVLPALLADLDRLGLRDGVEVRVGASLEVGAAWQGPIRLLVLDGDHGHRPTWEDVKTWGKHVIPGGVMVFHAREEWPGVARCYQEFLTLNRTWREVGRAGSLRLAQRRE